jgi:predicted TIM-barrel fold metal-dependent hydrolase
VTFSFVRSDKVSEIRSKLGHPVVDGDGHLMEFMPRVFEIVEDLAGASVGEQFRRHMDYPFSNTTSTYEALVPTYRVATGMAGSTLDRMTAVLPALMYQRLDQIGIDYALLYPSRGLSVFSIRDDDLRQVAARAFNTYYAGVFADFRDRLEPVAIIPTSTPNEAIAELEHAVRVLGLKAIVMNGNIPRSSRPDGSQRAWIDSLGHGSLFDYDPVWAKCSELGVAPTFHGVGFGWGSRVSSNNFVHNHLGHFAAAQESVCRSLVMGGVPRRFPDLRFAFLEGGTSWAAQLYLDLRGHFAKRNRDVVARHADVAIDDREAIALFDHFADGRLAGFTESFRQDVRRALVARPSDDSDDFAESGLTSLQDIHDVFAQFNFGCEADDPMNGLAFDERYLGEGTQLNAFFASDIGHWDVADMCEVLEEAWTLRERGLMDDGDFRAFTFGNTTDMLAEVNPRFFDGTIVGSTIAPIG